VEEIQSIEQGPASQVCTVALNELTFEVVRSIYLTLCLRCLLSAAEHKYRKMAALSTEIVSHRIPEIARIGIRVNLD